MRGRPLGLLVRDECESGLIAARNPSTTTGETVAVFESVLRRIKGAEGDRRQQLTGEAVPALTMYASLQFADALLFHLERSAGDRSTRADCASRILDQTGQVLARMEGPGIARSGIAVPAARRQALRLRARAYLSRDDDGSREAALAAAEESLAIVVDDPTLRGDAGDAMLHILCGEICSATDREHAARRHYRAALDIAADTGNPDLVNYVFERVIWFFRDSAAAGEMEISPVVARLQRHRDPRIRTIAALHRGGMRNLVPGSQRRNFTLADIVDDLVSAGEGFSGLGDQQSAGDAYLDAVRTLLTKGSAQKWCRERARTLIPQARTAFLAAQDQAGLAKIDMCDAQLSLFDAQDEWLEGRDS
ncbi:hypothetical protein [Cryptosporangium sp. NPDC051539]|uniref:hypothetical protein n=1 Tax=Cryptosporangium sp. NPDC051539 TaxID=3363962 RepID=UPI0037B95C64